MFTLCWGNFEGPVFFWRRESVIILDEINWRHITVNNFPFFNRTRGVCLRKLDYLRNSDVRCRVIPFNIIIRFLSGLFIEIPLISISSWDMIVLETMVSAINFYTQLASKSNRWILIILHQILCKNLSLFYKVNRTSSK